MSHTIEAPGAVIAYDVREVQGSSKPTLMLIGSPMDATGFATLSTFFTDRTVVTYDPRGAGRSQREPGAGESTPDIHADDLRRVIEAVGGPVEVFASSGGAVNALALVAKHPELVSTLVAHEPPAAPVLPDRANAERLIQQMRQTYEKEGFGPAMAQFMAITSHVGELPEDIGELPVGDPAAMGMPTDDDGTRDDVLFAQNLITCTHYEHDFDALRAASTRVVPAVSVEGAGTMAARGGEGVAERLGVEAVVFPSHHGGFMGGEFGYPGEPEAFAAKLREVLDGA
ncbi:alpha/beta fold hydrolase [Nonomuraea soli]|uniref:Pimeloyl-ACP methyl ester carboxylesterase n=1 Tax=Nonomuraea soli TaxID=1032476 RepID=A0A7W0CTD5_9ACTN|nr:alpha/beta hydrolase [Nonomuraea soli]MBA2896877.1 pimeloyl-ACP methyl ester carboxylesterase [Nonomuraea soli]